MIEKRDPEAFGHFVWPNREDVSVNEACELVVRTRVTSVIQLFTMSSSCCRVSSITHGWFVGSVQQSGRTQWREMNERRDSLDG